VASLFVEIEVTYDINVLGGLAKIITAQPGSLPKTFPEFPLPFSS
jgi:hypothetical protein